MRLGSASNLCLARPRASAGAARRSSATSSVSGCSGCPASTRQTRTCRSARSVATPAPAKPETRRARPASRRQCQRTQRVSAVRWWRMRWRARSTSPAMIAVRRPLVDIDHLGCGQRTRCISRHRSMTPRQADEHVGEQGEHAVPHGSASHYVEVVAGDGKTLQRSRQLRRVHFVQRGRNVVRRDRRITLPSTAISTIERTSKR